MSTADPTGLRQFIFGDGDLDDWRPGDGDSEAEPWQTFERARTAQRRGDDTEAERLWRSITDMTSTESRNVLQAWHFLRSIGVSPGDDVAKQALGAVAEVAVPEGHDLLAAYEDGSVRYLNYSGAATVIDTPLPTVQGPASVLLQVGGAIAQSIGPWDGPLPPLPAGHSRVMVLTPSGPHFGQGEDGALRAEPLAAAFLDAATTLLTTVVELTNR